MSVNELQHHPEHEGHEICIARFNANAERIAATRRRLDDVEDVEHDLVRKVAELEAEIQRLTAFADAMHGNAYSGGRHRFKRPVFRVIRGDGQHPNVIAFDVRKIEQWCERVRFRSRVQPAFGFVFITIAVTAAILVPKIARLVDPVAVSAAVAVQPRRSSAATAPPGVAGTTYKPDSATRITLPPPLVSSPKDRDSVPLSVLVMTRPPVLASPAVRGTPSPSPSSSSVSPSPSPTPPGTPSPSPSMSGVANGSTPAP